MNPDIHTPSTTAAWDEAGMTLNAIGDAVLSTDLAGRVRYLNLAAETMTGWSREAADGHPIDEVFHLIDRETREPVPNPMARAIQLNRTVGLTANCLLIRRDGQEAAIEDSAAPVHDSGGRVVGAVIVFRDVGPALETSRRMAHRAQHDVLTGLPNRLLLADRLTTNIATARRHHTPLAVLFLDVNGFKGINDSLGHAAGDRVLQSIAGRLTDALRRSDTVSRYGGDEFVIALAEMKRPEDAAVVGVKLLEAAAGPHDVGGRTVTVSASLGVSLYPDHGHDAEALISHADAAMYDAKRAGRGTLSRAAQRSAANC